MKTIRLPLFVLLGLAAAVVTRAAEAIPSSRVEVTFVEPEKFTDVKDAFMGSDSGRDAILGDLKDYIAKKADRLLPDGQKLTVTVTDVDLAGDFEPQRGPTMQDVRIIKEIYTPKIDLSYAVTDATGKVVKEGKRQLRDLSYMTTMNAIGRNDPRIYEKNLIDNWMREDLPRAKK